MVPSTLASIDWRRESLDCSVGGWLPVVVQPARAEAASATAMEVFRMKRRACIFFSVLFSGRLTAMAVPMTESALHLYHRVRIRPFEPGQAFRAGEGRAAGEKSAFRQGFGGGRRAAQCALDAAQHDADREQAGRGHDPIADEGMPEVGHERGAPHGVFAERVGVTRGIFGQHVGRAALCARGLRRAATVQRRAGAAFGVGECPAGECALEIGAVIGHLVLDLAHRDDHHRHKPEDDHHQPAAEPPILVSPDHPRLHAMPCASSRLSRPGGGPRACVFV
ncbi:hypothetical protein PT2222_310016 [Paraburkholderia tropica]